MLQIYRVKEIPYKGFDQLLISSQQEGFRFLTRLKNEWLNRQNRFNQLGEGLFIITIQEKAIGIGGINQDPYSEGQKTGRIRRFYIHPHHRKKGYGGFLLRHILDVQGNAFDEVRLRTDTEEASKFYEKHGFKRVGDDPNFTHKLEI